MMSNDGDGVVDDHVDAMMQMVMTTTTILLIEMGICDMSSSGCGMHCDDVVERIMLIGLRVNIIKASGA